MRRRPAYYTVYGLQDGTVYAVLQTRKPMKKSLAPGEKIDADEVYRTYVNKCDNFIDLPDRHYILRHVGMAGRLNTRRAIRELVLPRLDALEKQLAGIAEQLAALQQTSNTANQDSIGG